MGLHHPISEATSWIKEAHLGMEDTHWIKTWALIMTFQGLEVHLGTQWIQTSALIMTVQDLVAHWAIPWIRTWASIMKARGLKAYPIPISGTEVTEIPDLMIIMAMKKNSLKISEATIKVHPQALVVGLVETRGHVTLVEAQAKKTKIL